MIFSKLINYLTGMCWNDQGTTVVTNQTKARVQWNPTFQLVESFKSVPRLLDKDSGLRQIKLWFSLDGIILEENLLVWMKKKELQGELMVWRTKVQVRVQGYSFFQFLLFKWKKCYGLRTLFRAHKLPLFGLILELTWLVLWTFRGWLLEGMPNFFLWWHK
jgi:hypothetical protein